MVKAERGTTRVTIRLTNGVLEYFRDMVDKAGGGNYQAAINDALLEHIHTRSTRRGRASRATKRGVSERSTGVE